MFIRSARGAAYRKKREKSGVVAKEAQKSSYLLLSPGPTSTERTSTAIVANDPC
jgi:hypothetical protein